MNTNRINNIRSKRSVCAHWLLCCQKPLVSNGSQRTLLEENLVGKLFVQFSYIKETMVNRSLVITYTVEELLKFTLVVIQKILCMPKLIPLLVVFKTRSFVKKEVYCVNTRSRKKLLFWSLIPFLVIFLYYHYVLGGTVAFATIEEKIESNNTKIITIRFEDNRTENIKVPDIVWPFLEIGSEYFLSYRQNLLRSPFLVIIKPAS